MMVFLMLLLLHAVFGHPCDTVEGNFNDWLNDAEERDVVVVGGGVAGLSAMNKFLNTINPVRNVVLLEALDRLGGRVSTVRTELNSGEVLTEDGAEWIHGGKGNFLFHLAKEQNALAPKLGDNDWEVWIKRQNGANADERGFDLAKEILWKCDSRKALEPYYLYNKDMGYGQCHEDKFNQWYDSSRTRQYEKDAWHHYLHQYLNKDEGTDTWLDISARDADHFTDWGFDQWDQWKDGYETLTKYLKSSIPDSKVKLSSPVCRIYWDEQDLNNRALVVTKAGESFLAKHVIVTTSVGYLGDRHLQLFIPKLPRNYAKHLEGVKLGVADKIQLGWDKPWWGNKPLDLTVIWTQKNLPQEKTWLYGILEFLGVHQQPNLIQAFITGTYAKAMENLPEESVYSDILELLSNISRTSLPDPTFFRRTTWGRDEWFFGSYNSYVTPEGSDAGLTSRKPLAQPITNSQGKSVIFWAGEHTHTKRYGTVDGAMKKGKEVAKKLKDMLK